MTDYKGANIKEEVKYPEVKIVELLPFYVSRIRRREQSHDPVRETCSSGRPHPCCNCNHGRRNRHSKTQKGRKRDGH